MWTSLPMGSQSMSRALFALGERPSDSLSRDLSRPSDAQRNLARAVTEAGVAAKLGHVTPQMPPRSFASLAARCVVDPVQAAAARMTGHSFDV